MRDELGSFVRRRRRRSQKGALQLDIGACGRRPARHTGARGRRPARHTGSRGRRPAQHRRRNRVLRETPAPAADGGRRPARDGRRRPASSRRAPHAAALALSSASTTGVATVSACSRASSTCGQEGACRVRGWPAPSRPLARVTTTCGSRRRELDLARGVLARAPRLDEPAELRARATAATLSGDDNLTTICRCERWWRFVVKTRTPSEPDT